MYVESAFALLNEGECEWCCKQRLHTRKHLEASLDGNDAVISADVSLRQESSSKQTSIPV